MTRDENTLHTMAQLVLALTDPKTTVAARHGLEVTLRAQARSVLRALEARHG